MRLSDAIATGQVTIEKWKAGHLRSCALGMALNAVGREDIFETDNYYDIVAIWPWLENSVERPYGTGNTQAISAVYTLFDSFVMKGFWTLDQLIDWIRSVEPEDTPAPSETLVESCSSVEVIEK